MRDTEIYRLYVSIGVFETRYTPVKKHYLKNTLSFLDISRNISFYCNECTERGWLFSFEKLYSKLITQGKAGWDSLYCYNSNHLGVDKQKTGAKNEACVANKSE